MTVFDEWMRVLRLMLKIFIYIQIFYCSYVNFVYNLTHQTNRSSHQHISHGGFHNDESFQNIAVYGSWERKIESNGIFYRLILNRKRNSLLDLSRHWVRREREKIVEECSVIRCAESTSILLMEWGLKTFNGTCSLMRHESNDNRFPSSFTCYEQIGSTQEKRKRILWFSTCCARWKLCRKLQWRSRDMIACFELHRWHCTEQKTVTERDKLI